MFFTSIIIRFRLRIGGPSLGQDVAFTPSGHHDRCPTFARGDCGHGNEKIRVDFEERELLYLLKLKHTSKVKALLRDLIHPSEVWPDCGDGWEVAESTTCVPEPSRSLLLGVGLAYVLLRRRRASKGSTERIGPHLEDYGSANPSLVTSSSMILPSSSTMGCMLHI